MACSATDEKRGRDAEEPRQTLAERTVNRGQYRERNCHVMSATEQFEHSPPPRPGGQISLNYTARPGLGGLSIKNFLLSVITLGIYSFWGKTNVRRHIWSCVHVMDEPLEYTGTGKELFLGFLIVTGIIIVPLFLIQALAPFIFFENIAAQVVAQILAFVVVLYLIGVGIYRARRYRLSRTLWRGIRGTLTGSSWSFAWTNFWMTFLLPLSFLWSYPWMRMRLTSRMTNDMEFGSAPFGFSGPVGPLYSRFAIIWISSLVLMILLPFALWISGLSFDPKSMIDGGDGPITPDQTTLVAFFIGLTLLIIPAFVLLFAVLRAFYVAGEMNHFAQCTTFENVRFEMRATSWSLIGLAIGNFLILIFTLGIGAPFVQQRLVRYFCNRMTPVGSLDVASIQQSQAEVDRRGEGLAEVFDIDAF